MKPIYIISLLIIFFIGCKSTYIEEKKIGLEKITKEEPATKHKGKKDITEYYRNSHLILRIVKHYRTNKNSVWMTEQIIYNNDKKVLKLENTNFYSDPEEKNRNSTLNCIFYNFGEPDKEVSISIDEEKGTYKQISIYKAKSLYIYDGFELKNGLLVPLSDLELKKVHKVTEAVTDIMGELTKAIKTKNFDKKEFRKKLIKHKENIDKMKYKQ